MLELVTISFLKFESSACVTKCRKLLLHVSSLSVLIFHFSCVKRLVGKKFFDGESCSNLYNRLYSGILELCSKPLGQPQVDKRGLRSLSVRGIQVLVVVVNE